MITRGDYRGAADSVTIAADAATSNGQEVVSNAINATTTMASIPIATTAATTGSMTGG